MQNAIEDMNQSDNWYDSDDWLKMTLRPTILKVFARLGGMGISSTRGRYPWPCMNVWHAHTRVGGASNLFQSIFLYYLSLFKVRGKR